MNNQIELTRIALLLGFLAMGSGAWAEDSDGNQSTDSDSSDTDTSLSTISNAAMKEMSDTETDSQPLVTLEVDGAVAIPQMGSKTLSEEEVKTLEGQLEQLRRFHAEHEVLSHEIEGSKGLVKRVLEGRSDRNRSETLTLAIEFAQFIADKQKEGVEVSKYWEDAHALAHSLPDAVHGAVDRVAQNSRKLTDKELSLQEQSAMDTRLERDSLLADEMLGSLLSGVEVLVRFGVDEEKEKAKLRQRLSANAEMRSVFLELTIEDSSFI